MLILRCIQEPCSPNDTELDNKLSLGHSIKNKYTCFFSNSSCYIQITDYSLSNSEQHNTVPENSGRNLIKNQIAFTLETILLPIKCNLLTSQISESRFTNFQCRQDKPKWPGIVQ
ncbi:hypothetical protein PP707_01570 [Acetobacter pasteurianus]|nr:hypothetical protein [Acetobacter pasteurianus]